MKTDVEVLDGAIAILGRDGMWCQGAYYEHDEEGHRISFCAAGAIAESIGLWEHAYASWAGVWPKTGADDALVSTLADQAQRICTRVAAANGKDYLSEINDADDTTVEDVILAMKKVREEIAGG